MARVERIARFERDVNGNLQAFTASGRKRRWWKAEFRLRAKKYKKAACERCGAKEDLTVHHKVPLSQEINLFPENIETLCTLCHRETHGYVKGAKKAGEER